MSLVKRGNFSAALSEPANPVGKVMVVGGSGALAVALLAALLPFGVMFWAIAIVLLGLFII